MGPSRASRDRGSDVLIGEDDHGVVAAMGAGFALRLRERQGLVARLGLLGIARQQEACLDDRVILVGAADAAGLALLAVRGDLQLGGGVEAIAGSEIGEAGIGATAFAQRHHHAGGLAWAAGDRDRLDELGIAPGGSDQDLRFCRRSNDGSKLR